MRKLFTTILGAAMLVCCVAAANAADKYPPGPGGTCLDSVSIARIQNPAALCHPATLDTVLGVAGIITGFDAKASAYSFYIQNRANLGVPANAHYTGINIFTGATNYNSAPFSLALGDSVVVYGTTQEFPPTDGETEIEGPDVVQGTNDIVIRKVSSGVPLPAFITGTTNTFRYLPTNPNGELYEGMLVRIPTAMRVARTSLTGGQIPFNSFMLVNQVGSAVDSVLIDGNTLATFTPPALGTTVGSVQGIMNQRASGGASSYRIQLRDGNDIVVATPPNLIDAFPIADNVVRVLFDRNITLASAENEANYSLASLGTINLATQINGGTVDLNVTNGLVDGDVEGVTVNGVVASSSGIAMTTPQSRSFVNGVVDPSVVQAADPAALAGSPCEDRSRYAGVGTSFGTLRVAVRGVSTGKFGSLYYLEGASGGVRNGLSVFGPSQPLTEGHRFLVVGFVQEFGTGAANGRETEIVSTIYIVDEGVAASPAPLVETIGALADTTCDNASPQLFSHLATGEDYEGVLVKVRGRITEERNAGDGFFLAGEYGVYSDTILVSNSNSSYTFNPDSADVVSITGIVASNSASSRRFRILPRSNADIIVLGNNTGVEGQPRSLQFAVSPNPARIARMSFALPVEANVDLAIYDLSGRKITTVLKGRLDAGNYSREWSGLDSRGKSVGAGMYFYKLRVNDEVRTVRGIKLN